MGNIDNNYCWQYVETLELLRTQNSAALVNNNPVVPLGGKRWVIMHPSNSTPCMT